MKKTFRRALPFLMVILFALIVVCGVFAQASDESVVYFTPRNYNEDGTHSDVISQSSDNGVNLAEGDPTLLDYGEVLNVVIFICFADEDISKVFPSSLTEEIADSFNGNSSLSDYYSTLSYGDFTVKSVFPKKNTAYFVYKDKNSRSYYSRITSESGLSRYAAESSLLNGAVAAASEWFTESSSRVDANSDGFVDSVSFVVSGKSGNEWGALLWPHAWNLDKITSLASSGSSSATLCGGAVRVDNYTLTFAENFTIGLIAHEFGHLVGLPDLYHTEYDKDYYPVGYWDLMHLNCPLPQFNLSYLRSRYLGFLGKKQVAELTSGGTYSLTPTASTDKETVIAYKITLTDKESVWLEYRTNSLATYDSGLPSSGLVVYRINNSVYGNTQGRKNSSLSPDEVFVYRPSISGLTASENLSRAALTTNDGGVSTLGNATATAKHSPSCIYLTNGSNTGIVITVTEQTSEKITFNIDLGSYDCDYIGDSYVVGTDKNGNSVKNEHHAYYGEIPDIKVYLKYSTRPAAIELVDFTVEYEERVCPEGQTAYVVFTDANGVRKIPFTLYIYDVLRLEARVTVRPDVTVIPAGGSLSLSGLVISVSYLSGKTELIRYDETSPSDWVIVEGLDVNTHGRYDHVLIRYRENVTFVLSGVLVNSNISALRVDETDTRHLSGDSFTPSFNVIGIFADGTERALTDSEYEVTYLSDVPFEKTVAVIKSKENAAVSSETFVILTSNAAVSSINVSSSPDKVVFDYAEEPVFGGGTLSVTFDNGKTLSLDMINYSSLLLSSFSYSKTGAQKLTAGIGYKQGYGGASFSVDVTVLPKSSSVLTVNSDSAFKENISINDRTQTIIVYRPMTLGELAASLNSRLNLEFTDVSGDFTMPLSAFSSRKVGTNLRLSLVTDGGAVVLKYSVNLLGDADGDGEITDEDVSGWLNALLGSADTGIYLDADGDGTYTLNDFVILLRRKNGGEE